MNYKVLQITTAPQNMQAVFTDSKDESKSYTRPVTCLALVEDETGGRWIEPVCMMTDGFHFYASLDDDFFCFDFN